jgi:periplasmic protein TonB
MADGSLRSVDWHANLIVPAGADAEAVPAAPFLAAAPLRIVLSEASDLWGVSRAGWLAAGLFLAALGAGGALLPWRVAPPPAWPAAPVHFRVVFEEPAPLPAVPEIAALPAPVEPPSAAPAEPPPIVPAPETATTEVEPEPPPIATTRAPALLPQPPARKPPFRHTSPPAPHSVATESTSPAPAVRTADLAAAIAPAARGLSRPPSLAYDPKPEYPAAARMRGLQGRVLLHIDIAADGTPASVSVATSSGHAILDEAAMMRVRSWRFHPALRDGVPIESTRDLPVDFRLED